MKISPAPVALRVFSAALFAAGAVSAFADGTEAQPRKGVTVEGITEYTLANGLRVLLFPDASKPTVTVNATYLVGSRHEGYGESGMAHLLEHLLFKGTPRHPRIWQELRDHGARFNGTTSVDRTNYFETLPATEENLEFALDLEADRMVNSFVSAEDLQSEFSVVRNEFEMGENEPLRVLSQRVQSTAYLWHNYGKSTIGSREDIERVPIERLQAFYRNYYQPDNCILVVAGKFDEARTLARIVALFGPIPKPTRTLERTYTWEPTQDGEREVVLRRVGDMQALIVAYHVCAAAHPDSEPLQVLADALDADETGRLVQALVTPGLATRVSARVDNGYDPGLLEIQVQARLDQSMAEIRKRLLETLDGLGRTVFTAEEVARSRRATARQFDRLMADPDRVGVMLTEAAASGDWRLLFLHRDRMAKVTPEDVARVAAHYLKPSNRTIGVFLPDPAPDRVVIPPTPDVAELVREVRGGAAMTAGDAFEATYAAVEAGTARSTLPVGMKLALLPRKTRNEQVSVSMNFRYGSEAELTGKTEAAAMIARMLPRGTAKRSRRAIQDRIDELKAQLSVGGGGGGGRGSRRGGGGGGTPGVLPVTLQCGRADLPAVLELAAEILRQPAFAPEEFEQARAEVLASLEQRRSDPMSLAMTEWQRRLHPCEPGDLRYVPTVDEQIVRVKAVTLDEVKALYARLLGAGAAEVAAVGDFEPAGLTAELTRHFGDWKSAVPFERIERRFHPTAAGELVLATPDKTNAVYGLGIAIELRDDDPDYAAVFLANYLLGGSSSSRLPNRIRQQEGLSYSCSSTLQVGAHDRAGSFLAAGICAPQNAERALDCAREEIVRLLKDGVPPGELDDARKAYRQSIELLLANDGSVASWLASGLYTGRTAAFSEALLARIETLTPEELIAGFAKYVKPESLFVLRAGDFAKAAGGEPPAKAE